MISEVMSFVRSNSCENGITKETCLQNAQENHLLQSVLGSKAIDWNFQSVKYLDELVEQHDGTRKKKLG